jgi:hypothetical protein
VSQLLRCFPEPAAQAFMKTGTQITGKLDRLAIAENFDGHFGLINYQFAFVALNKMALDFVLRCGVHFTVNEVREFADDFVAVQFSLPCLK